MPVVAADAKGTAALILCLSLGALYQQAPKRKPKAVAGAVDVGTENTPLLDRPAANGAVKV